MCEYCETSKEKRIKKSNIKIKEEKFLVAKKESAEYIYDLNYCPFCGKKLSYYKREKIYVSNIKKDKELYIGDLNMPSEYSSNPLHTLICDKKYESGEIEEQTELIISASQVQEIKDKGYCYITYTKATRPYVY